MREKVKHLRVQHLTMPIFVVFLLAIIGLILGSELQSGMIVNLSIMTIFLYMIFAFTHHHFDKTFKLEVIVEYILMAALVLILIVGVAFS